jgi:cell division protease FtsH
LSDREHPFDQLATVSAGSVLNADLADVGRYRERARLERLWRLSLIVGLPTLFLWFRILEHRPFDVFALPHLNLTIVALFFVPVLLLVAMVVMYASYGRSPHFVVRPEQIDVRLSDVVGIDLVKAEVVRSLNLFLAHKAFSSEMGGRPRRGLLFDGPPGTGKTYTAKALAAEANVPFLFATATSFQSSMQGATQRKIRSYFKALRALARKEGGAIGFIDEFDALGGARSGVSASTPSGALDGMPMSCGGLEGLASVVSPAKQQTQFVGSGDLGMAVQELLVQLSGSSARSPTPQTCCCRRLTS